jgi:hypothetical protein
VRRNGYGQYDGGAPYDDGSQFYGAPTQYGADQYSTDQYSADQYHTVQYANEHYNNGQYDGAQYPMAQAPLQAKVKRPNPGLAARRRNLIIGAVSALVLGIGALTAFVWPGYANPAPPQPTPTVTVTAAPPAPTAAPAPREGDQTALVAALPDTVLGWVQAGISAQQGTAPGPSWQNDYYAVEAWTVNYIDGLSDSGRHITVQVGQWATGDDAGNIYRRLATAPGANSINHGDVHVGSDVVGTYSLYDLGEGLGEIIWRNGTVVIKAQGPLEDLPDFFTAYRL